MESGFEGRRKLAARVGGLAWLSAALVFTVAAQETSHPRPRVAAYRSDIPISVDGVLDEEAWAMAEVASGFTQREPEDGVPASERTEFSVAYTASTLYFALRAFDSQPRSIIAKEMERDSRLDNDDSIVLVLDTFADKRNSYSFEFNPNGARADALVTDEGRDLNGEWNGVWTVAARRTPEGWVAEVGIPFSTMRFDPGIETWGLNVRRLIRHKNEEVNWAALGREISADTFSPMYAAYRVSLAGELTGLQGLRPSRQFDIKPFFTGTIGDRPQETAGGSDTDGQVGLDLKWGVTKSLSVDLTYNTDFAQVEVDDQQINLTRFSVFFPEKREFFLENAGIFEFSTPQRNSFEPAQTRIFFSRRIGLDAGKEVPIEWGGRVTGRIGGWNIGVLSVVTDDLAEEGRLTPGTTWSVARLKRNVGKRSSVGAIVTDRSSSGGLDNRVVGLDFDYKPTDKLAFQFFGAHSEDPGVDDDELAYGLGLDYTTRDFTGSFDFQEVQRGFRPGVGFLLREDFKRYNPRLTYLPRINRFGIRTWYLGAALDYYERSSDGRLESRKLEVWPVGMRTMRGDDIWRGALTSETERLFVPFEIQPGVVIPPGLYRFDGWNVGGRTNQRRPLGLRGQFGGGEFFDGTHTTYSITLQWRPSRFLRSETSWSLNDVELPRGAFTTNLYSESIDLSFSPSMRLNTLVQYNDAADFIGLNVRFNWEYRPGSDLYVVYNHNWDAMAFNSRQTRTRQLIVKLTYLFQI